MPTVAPPTATPPPVTTLLPIPLTTHLFPSPDGALLAAEYSSGIKLFTVTGQEQGSLYTGGAGIDGSWSWFPDSSGILLGRNHGPLVIMDRQGQVRSTGLDVSSPELSQDGQWIGGTALTSNNSVVGAEIAPRSGGPARMLAKGGTFLGWQNNRAIYSTGGYGSQLYALDPSGGTPAFLEQLGSTVGVAAPRGDVNSPDGQILFLEFTKPQPPMMLVGNQLLPAPQATPLLFCVGGHDVITVAPHATDPTEDYLIQDVTTGAVVKNTGLSPSVIGTVLAVSGNWLVTSTSADTDPQDLLPLDLVNDATKTILANAVGLDPNETLESDGVQPIVVPLGNQGKFLTTFSITNAHAGQPTSVLVLINAASAG